MCYSECPYERTAPMDVAGECARPKMQGTPLSHCYEPEEWDMEDGGYVDEEE